jgi:hydroxyethylthiazole kinase
LKPSDRASIAAEAAGLLAEVRRTRPLVQAITNFVSMDVAANALLAIGASPAMVHAPEETPEFVALANALVLNIGTLSRPWVDSMSVAAAAAQAQHKPWALDPVGAGATRFRDQAVARLLTHKPAVIRGNASEIMAVARVAGLTVESARPKGVDSSNTTDEAEALAIALARHCGCVVAATGAVDFVTDGARVLWLANGAPMMARVTALGCALTAVVGAFLAVTPDPLDATVAAIAVYGVAGEMAAKQASRPGSFRMAFIDALDAIEEADIQQRLKVLP